MPHKQDEAYLESRGWRKRRPELGWWTDPQCPLADFRIEWALKMQRKRDAGGEHAA